MTCFGLNPVRGRHAAVRTGLPRKARGLELDLGLRLRPYADVVGFPI